jgi:hypothetical protein
MVPAVVEHDVLGVKLIAPVHSSLEGGETTQILKEELVGLEPTLETLTK